MRALSMEPSEIWDRHMRVLKAIRAGKSYAAIAHQEGYTPKAVNKIALRNGFRKLPHMSSIKRI
jgi:DNA-binding CsgD family transcriptional regulator